MNIIIIMNNIIIIILLLQSMYVCVRKWNINGYIWGITSCENAFDSYKVERQCK